jgi:cytoskeletal protein CcmA (bactofilin family)
MANPNDQPRDTASILGPSLRFKGELHADEDLLIRGKIEGSIKHSQHLTICRDGQVRADIEGQVIAVEGTVDGDLTATTSVAVMGGAKLTGDVCAPSVSIVEGANFNGSVIMDSAKPARSHRRSDGRPAPTSASVLASASETARAPGTR